MSDVHEAVKAGFRGDCVNGQHRKVYSGNVLLTSPPQRPWICSVCKKEGVDQDPSASGPSYEELKRAKASGLTVNPAPGHRGY